MLPSEFLQVKTAHVLGAILLVGNVVVTGLWNVWAVRTGQPAVIAFAQRAVMWADGYFTLIGGALVSATGIAMVIARGDDPWTVIWLRYGIGLLGLSTLLWLVVLLPCQVGMERLATRAEAGEPLSPRFYRLYRIWNVVGWGATGLLLLALALMVLRPR